MNEHREFPSAETEEEKNRRFVRECLELGYRFLERNVPESHEFTDGTTRQVYKTVLEQGAKKKVFYLESPVEVE